MRETQV